MSEEIELTPEQMEVEKAKIRDNVNNPSNDKDINLPSDNTDKKYAGVYENVEELKKGIVNLKADVPEYMLNGMNEEALEQYYTDLRKEFSSKPKVEETKAEEPKVEEPKAEDTKLEKPEAISNELWQELDAEFVENGGLSDEYYDKLNKLGIPNVVIDKYIDGLKAEAQNFTTNVYSLAGGEEQYNEIKAWAEENYSQEELDMIVSGSKNEILFKMKAVKADYDSKVDNTGQRFVGSSAQGSQKGYTSQEQYMMDVASPEYRKDPRFKAKVQAKFKASSFGT